MQSATMKRIDKFSYDINKVLGSGSYSEVYSGVEDATGKKVAIKVMNLNSLKNSFVYDLILSEMTTMKSFKHKNIVQLYEVLQTANNLYMVLEYCNQGDLRKLLTEKKRLSESEAVRIIYEIIQGYQDILNHHIIHRDMKPENILINDGVCKIADFGFAKALSNQNEQMISVPVGTPLYCSPQYYTVKTDVWSLGIMFYEMLYGTTPWPCQGFEDLKQQMSIYPYVRYPNNRAISPAAFDFLHNVLQFEENKRLSWEEIRSHEIFNQSGINMQQEIKSAEIKSKHKHKHKEHKKHKNEKKEVKTQNEIIVQQQIQPEKKKTFKFTQKPEGFYEEYSPKKRQRPPQLQTNYSQQQQPQQQQISQFQQQPKQEKSGAKFGLTSPSQRYKKIQQTPPELNKRPDSAMAKPLKNYQINLDKQQLLKTAEKSQFSTAFEQYKSESPLMNDDSKEAQLSLSPKLKQRPFPASPLKKLTLKPTSSVNSEQDLYMKNNEIILFNLNYLNVLNLLKNLCDVTTFMPLNLSQIKLSYIILKHSLLKITPLNNIPSLIATNSPRNNPLEIENPESYIALPTFQLYYSKIATFYNSYESQFSDLTKHIQPVIKTMKKDKTFQELYRCPMQDSKIFYEFLISFLFNLIAELNNYIKQELDAMQIIIPETGQDVHLITKNQENCVLLLAFLIKYFQIAKANNLFFNEITNLSQVVNFSQILLEANVNVTIKFYFGLQQKIKDIQK